MRHCQLNQLSLLKTKGVLNLLVGFIVVGVVALPVPTWETKRGGGTRCEYTSARSILQITNAPKIDTVQYSYS